ncbi:Membrane protein [Candidatus Terasakiella magnetica]|uniref:Membrane protein n=1 Tax=Candidatus Terasakiella magnetica TaxID=1867952 RepID=A0A1C3RE22_9PROT|nr:DUF423 domain-containing protein [Candidatus Terasakiella magnetica]SCA55464.1 Membrane protein [Candidatus Terasakiella magnetica]
MRIWLILAGLMGAQTVIAGAISAHADLDSASIILIDKAVQYEIWHALALVGIAILAKEKSRIITIAGCCFTAGVALFCGTLYMKGFWEMSLFPMSAPIGGTSFILGWLCLALYGFMRDR